MPSVRALSLLAAVALAALGCHHEPPPDAPVSPDTSVVAPPAPPPPASTPAPVASAPEPVASASAAPVASAAAPPAPAEEPVATKEPEAAPKEEVDWKNKAKPPLESEDLEKKGRALLSALKADDVKKAAHFFFPRDPFLPLKDIKNPGKYWDQLFRIYKNDVHELHDKHAKDWDDAEFVSFELGSPPKWVKPGEEANKIGYYRTFNAKLRYTSRGKTRAIEVKTIISWQKGWFITHLLPIKK